MGNESSGILATCALEMEESIESTRFPYSCKSNESPLWWTEVVFSKVRMEAISTERNQEFWDEGKERSICWVETLMNSLTKQPCFRTKKNHLKVLEQGTVLHTALLVAHGPALLFCALESLIVPTVVAQSLPLCVQRRPPSPHSSTVQQCLKWAEMLGCRVSAGNRLLRKKMSCSGFSIQWVTRLWLRVAIKKWQKREEAQTRKCVLFCSLNRWSISQLPCTEGLTAVFKRKL